MRPKFKEFWQGKTDGSSTQADFQLFQPFQLFQLILLLHPSQLSIPSIPALPSISTILFQVKSQQWFGISTASSKVAPAPLSSPVTSLPIQSTLMHIALARDIPVFPCQLISVQSQINKHAFGSLLREDPVRTFVSGCPGGCPCSKSLETSAWHLLGFRPRKIALRMRIPDTPIQNRKRSSGNTVKRCHIGPEHFDFHL